MHSLDDLHRKIKVEGENYSSMVAFHKNKAKEFPLGLHSDQVNRQRGVWVCVKSM